MIITRGNLMSRKRERISSVAQANEMINEINKANCLGVVFIILQFPHLF
jgi:hypothetical protein